MDNADEEIQSECIMFMYSFHTTPMVLVFAVIHNSNMSILCED